MAGPSPRRGRCSSSSRMTGRCWAGPSSSCADAARPMHEELGPAQHLPVILEEELQRPRQLFLEDDGKVLGGPELLVRGRSQADAHGLIVPLPQRSVAVLSSGSLALRIRRVRGAARVGGEQTDWKGVLVASIAALLIVTGMKFWSATVPPPKVSAGDPELSKPRPLVVRPAA